MCKYKVATMGGLCSFVCMVLVLVGLFTPEWTVSKADTTPPAEKEAAIPADEKGCKATSGAVNTYRSNVIVQYYVYLRLFTAIRTDS
jgi:hypothetical protein